MINVLNVAKIIINIAVHHHRISKSIITDQDLPFTLKLWFLLCYFLQIKRKLSTAFHFQISGQKQKQNSIIEMYLSAFVN